MYHFIYDKAFLCYNHSTKTASNLLEKSIVDKNSSQFILAYAVPSHFS